MSRRYPAQWAYDDEDMEYAGDSRASMERFVQYTKWHRKGLVLLAVVALVVVWSVRTGRAAPYMASVTSDWHQWTSWARSSAGTAFVYTLAALIALDLAVDIAFKAWTKRHPTHFDW